MTRLIYLRDGFVSGSVARMAGVPALPLGGGVGRGTVTKKASPLRGM